MAVIEILFPSALILFASFMFSIGYFLIGSLAIIVAIVYAGIVLWKRRNKVFIE